MLSCYIISKSADLECNLLCQLIATEVTVDFGAQIGEVEGLSLLLPLSGHSVSTECNWHHIRSALHAWATTPVKLMSVSLFYKSNLTARLILLLSCNKPHRTAVWSFNYYFILYYTFCKVFKRYLYNFTLYTSLIVMIHLQYN